MNIGWEPIDYPSWQNRDEYVKRVVASVGDEPEELSGFVYVLLTEDGRRCKIGYSKQPIVRMSQVQSESRTRVRMVKYFPGSMRTERSLHARFAAYSLGHEWFTYAGELKDFVDALRDAL